MKFRIFLIISIFFLIILPQLISAETLPCIDSDHGKVYYQKGKLSWRGLEWEDVCDGNNLTELYCVGIDFHWKVFECPGGCEDGKCINGIEPFCKDSDGGNSPWYKGVATTEEKQWTDTCVFNSSMTIPAVVEYYCFEKELKEKVWECADGCEDGACIKGDNYFNGTYRICTDSDEGKNFYEKGNLIEKHFDKGELYMEINKNDSCTNDVRLLEYDCSPYYATIQHDCEYGCADGACKQNPEEIPKAPEKQEEQEKEPKEETKTETDEIDTCSSGCLVDDKCLSLGFRKNGKYCSLDGEMIEQKEGNKPCDNNFECSSNACLSNECVEESFIDKIIKFFLSLFSWWE